MLPAGLNSNYTILYCMFVKRNVYVLLTYRGQMTEWNDHLKTSSGKCSCQNIPVKQLPRKSSFLEIDARKNPVPHSLRRKTKRGDRQVVVPPVLVGRVRVRAQLSRGWFQLFGPAIQAKFTLTRRICSFSLLNFNSYIIYTVNQIKRRIGGNRRTVTFF